MASGWNGLVGAGVIGAGLALICIPAKCVDVVPALLYAAEVGRGPLGPAEGGGVPVTMEYPLIVLC